jgi:Gpi18-like mannosyltransferase
MIACYFFASRFYLFVIGMMSVHIIVPGPNPHSMEPLDLFNNWDTLWYMGIARDGYQAHENSTAFFPLYPILLHLAGFIDRDLRVDGYLISNALFFASCVLLWKLVARDYGAIKVADRAVLFLVFGPVSFFFSTIYTESLFLFLALGLAYSAAARRWLAAGCCGYLAALTRPVGILLGSLLAVEFATAWWQSRRSAGKPPPPYAFLTACALTLGGLATYCLYLQHIFHYPFQFIRAEAHWNRHLAFPWVPFERFRYLAFYDVWFDAAVVTAVVVLIFGFAFRLRPSHSILSVVLLLFYLCTTQLESIPRFLGVVFPFYITIGMGAVRWPKLEPLLLAGSVMLLTLSTILFVNGYWFT